MTVLSDRNLTAMFGPSDQIGPASLDLHIGDALDIWPRYILRDPRMDQSHSWRPAPMTRENGIDKDVWVLRPGWRYLATTRERLKILPTHAAQIDARSSWGRDGLAVICGPAGWLDPGYEGRPTLELSVVGSELVLWPGARICQLILHELLSPCTRPYSGKYQGDDVPTPSRSHLDAEAV